MLPARRAGGTGRAIAFLLIALLAPSVQAQERRDYVVELVIFEHLGAQAPGGGGYWAPAPRPAVTLGGERAAQAGLVPVEAPLLLADDVRTMNASGRYRVLQHLHWLQPGLAQDEAIALNIQIGPAIELFVADTDNGIGEFLPAAIAPRPDRPRTISTATLSGTLKVYLGRFLHLESHLVYTDPNAGRSYRLDESRKMRSQELHYIDNPRFGILTRMLRAEDVDMAGRPGADEQGAQPVQADIVPGNAN